MYIHVKQASLPEAAIASLVGGQYMQRTTQSKEPDVA